MEQDDLERLAGDEFLIGSDISVITESRLIRTLHIELLNLNACRRIALRAARVKRGDNTDFVSATSQPDSLSASDLCHAAHLGWKGEADDENVHAGTSFRA